MPRAKSALSSLKWLLLVSMLAACTESQAPAPETQGRAWEILSDGIVVDIDQDGFQKLRLLVVDDAIIRVTATPGDDFSKLPDTLMITADPSGTGFTVAEEEGAVVLKTGSVHAEVRLDNGVVHFKDPSGQTLLAEAGRSLSAVRADPGEVDADSFAVRQQFLQQANEGLYGLGQQQDGRVNYAGQNIELTTYNMEISIPFLASTEGYGLLWNNTSITRLGDPEPPHPLAEGFELFDAEGNQGGLTARYFDGEELLLERVEADLDYQFLSHANVREHPLPEEVADADNLRITWEGTIVPKQAGRHEFKM